MPGGVTAENKDRIVFQKRKVSNDKWYSGRRWNGSARTTREKNSKGKNDGKGAELSGFSWDC